jgi:dTDP-4-dehydrorhamnose reductase
MKILVTGGNGQIATQIKVDFPSHWQLHLPSHDELDITDSRSIDRAMTTCEPDVVINTAAFTKVDLAEKNPTAAFAVNADAVGKLAQQCHIKKIPLIHLSTDYVFDGQASHPYPETHRPNPLNQYGLSKWRGEQAIVQHCESYVILRVSSVFGAYGHNFVKTILQLAAQQDPLRLVVDQIHAPTAAASIAQVLVEIILALPTKPWGIFHYCDKPETTWYDFACRIVDVAKRSRNLPIKTLIPISSADFAAFAQRPHYSVLDCEKINRFWVSIKSIGWIHWSL